MLTCMHGMLQLLTQNSVTDSAMAFSVVIPEQRNKPVSMHGTVEKNAASHFGKLFRKNWRYTVPGEHSHEGGRTLCVNACTI